MSPERRTRRRRGERGRHRKARRRRWPTLVGAALVVGIAAGAGAFVHRRLALGAAGNRHANQGPGAGRASGSGPSPAPTSTTAPPPPLTVAGLSPASGATDLALAPTLTIQLSAPLASSSPMPALSPSVPGSWHRAGATLAFHATGRLVPGAALSLTLPGGDGGLVGASGQHLAGNVTAHFTVRPGSTLRLQELLAELGYLPVSFASGSAMPASTLPGPTPSSAAALEAEATTPGTVSLDPLPGTFAWRFPHVPSQLAAAWQPGTWNLVTKGAVMTFEASHGLAVDGIAGPAVWGRLLEAAAARQATTAPYDYLLASLTDPETLYVWQNGSVVAQSPTNSGVPGALTAPGTFPVYARYQSTTMSGTNPDGSHYEDPGVPYVAYFNGGDAVHGFPRTDYGRPQSDGCLELPIAAAARIFDDDPIGTLVTVTNGDLSNELGAAPPAYTGASGPS